MPGSTSYELVIGQECKFVLFPRHSKPVGLRKVLPSIADVWLGSIEKCLTSAGCFKSASSVLQALNEINFQEAPETLPTNGVQRQV